MPKPQDIFWVRYEARRALTRLLGLSAPAELAHRRFADSVWAGNGWPSAEPPAAAQLARARLAKWPAIQAELIGAGWRIRRGAFHHPEVGDVLARAQAAWTGFRRGGARGSATRWRRPPAPAPAAPPGPDPPMTNSSPSQDQPLASSDRERLEQEQSTETIKTAERSTRSVSPLKKTRAGEADFLRDLAETLRRFAPDAVEQEQTNWGGWWRNRYRQSPDKARRVLAEIGAMVKERAIRKTPGAAAADLWKRLP